MIDDRLSSTSVYVDYACKRTAIATVVLSRALSNNSAIRCSRRRVLVSVTSFMLPHGAVVCKAALSRQCNLQKLCRVQRMMNLRVISAFRKVSTVAAEVVAGVMPNSVQMLERPRCSTGSTSGTARNVAGGPIT
ncbi:uncharacterized protein LOC129738053 [Uranotaenia lowii]|uniref:uncharacterized protein LOC129738053 n=1 Tax=Uranotaenia lowii TaxID=190385 RepID=UPI002478C643|nr:uncharacterized protein LOC129738053 [Uranotaenia lowii]